jgi:UDP-3-O-[3-hydroxymyristoyl] N-acetylglucosamine deacetylase
MTRTTIARPVTASGPALHAGSEAGITLMPGLSGSGIIFHNEKGELPARWDLVGETRLGTVLTKDGNSIAVVEHLMAAIAGAGLDDLLILFDGPEPPILSGDAQSYLDLIDQAGTVEQEGERFAIEVLKPVEVRQGEARAALLPSDDYSLSFTIEFPSKAIGTQTYDFDFTPDSFRKEIASARTFGFLHEFDALTRAGLARGASIENTLVIDGDHVKNESLRRYPDEFVRHKILDAVGDLALAGSPLKARFEGHKSGHGLNNQLLRALFADPLNSRKVRLA